MHSLFNLMRLEAKKQFNDPSRWLLCNWMLLDIYSTICLKGCCWITVFPPWISFTYRCLSSIWFFSLWYILLAIIAIRCFVNFNFIMYMSFSIWLFVSEFFLASDPFRIPEAQIYLLLFSLIHVVEWISGCLV